MRAPRQRPRIIPAPESFSGLADDLAPYDDGLSANHDLVMLKLDMLDFRMDRMEQILAEIHQQIVPADQNSLL
jgi:hypothetical protein